MMSDGPSGFRDTIGARLRTSRVASAIELLVVPLLLGVHAAGWFIKPKLPLLLFGWLSLWLRRVGWRKVGLTRPRSWTKTVAAAIVIGLAYDALDIKVVLPLLHRMTGEPLDLAAFASLKGNTGMLLTLIAASWISAAFPEELLYRGYVLNRLADILGRTATSWTVCVAWPASRSGSRTTPRESRACSTMSSPASCSRVSTWPLDATCGYRF